MSAVLHDAQAVDQIPLIAPAPAPEPELLACAVWGKVDRQAQVRISTDGGVHLVVEIRQPKGRLPFVVIHHCPATQRDQLEHLAQVLAPGTAAVIRCLGIELGRFEGRDVLRPVICEAICAANFSPFNPEHH